MKVGTFFCRPPKTRGPADLVFTVTSVRAVNAVRRTCPALGSRDSRDSIALVDLHAESMVSCSIQTELYSPGIETSFLFNILVGYYYVLSLFSAYSPPYAGQPRPARAHT